ncbi:F-box protein [Scenedesmus sp. PABB004]|nr:F-box protein [Scenedesmus sp. PABB004]
MAKPRKQRQRAGGPEPAEPPAEPLAPAGGAAAAGADAAVEAHPYGVQPWGNFYLSRVPEIRTSGLGALAALADELVLGLLYDLPAADLARLGLASRALYVFAHTQELWKNLAMQELDSDFSWCGSWRETYLSHRARRYVRGSHRPLRVAGFYSDLLHQPWLCARLPLQPAWLEVDNVPRWAPAPGARARAPRPAHATGTHARARPACHAPRAPRRRARRRAGLSAAEFVATYEAPNTPVVLTDGAAGWPALAKWSREYLSAALAGRPVIVGNMPWRFAAYAAYCDTGAPQEEMPLYLFDKAFASACPALAADYWVPPVFTEDLFALLGEEARPDYRWLIVGPPRSGSSFHVDPNATCAWNAVVRGAKKWVLFPPGAPPPGVHPSPDGADVAAPVSLVEWFTNFYDEARAAKRPPLEAVVRAGEVLYVPRGWWHMAINLDECVAVTQNYASPTGLGAVLDFLRPGRPELVSGCAAADRGSLHDRFVAALRARRPELLDVLQAARDAADAQRAAEHRLSALFRETRRPAAPGEPGGCEPGGDEPGGAACGGGGGGGGFSFSFDLPPAPPGGGETPAAEPAGDAAQARRPAADAGGAKRAKRRAGMSECGSVCGSVPATPRASSGGFSRSDSGSGIPDPRALRMVFVVRRDLAWGRQKLAVMVAHAALALFKKNHKQRNPALGQWELAKGPKLVLRADDEAALLVADAAARAAGWPAHSLVEATGDPERPRSRTILALGPMPAEALSSLGGGLVLLQFTHQGGPQIERSIAMKGALCALAALLLAGPALATLGDNGMTTYNGRTYQPNTLTFGNQLVVDNAMKATLDLTEAMLTGTYKAVPNDPGTEKKVVDLECLNSVAPAPLNWKMWCPGKDAVVKGWTDNSGAAHRSITLRPQANMTSTMATWFISAHVLGLMPPVVEFQGNKYYYYHLWHPLDHVEAAWTLGPAVPLLQKGPPIYTLIHERYRNPEGSTMTRHYETNGWFYVHDSITNLMKNRYVITMPLMGLPTWTMIIEFNDTPEGMVVDIEVVAGIPSKGFDERAPAEGFLTAAGMNEAFTAPLLASQKGSPDWEESINAISRHAIEEFSNLQFFVPVLYEKATLLGAKGINWIPTLGTWMQYNNKTSLNAETISFYSALSALARKQTDTSATPKGAAVKSLVNATRAVFAHATAVATELVEAKSEATYVPLSNAVTKAAYETNAERGAHPEADVSIPSVVAALKAAIGSNATKPTFTMPTLSMPSLPTFTKPNFTMPTLSMPLSFTKPTVAAPAAAASADEPTRVTIRFGVGGGKGASVSTDA